MSAWGKNDWANNSPFWANALVRRRETTANQTNLFGNTTSSGIVSNVTVGLFGVGNTETGSAGGVASVRMTANGDNFITFPAVTFTGTNTGTALANATAVIVGVTANSGFYGSGWASGDTVVIDETGATNTTAPNVVVATTKLSTIALGSNTGSGYANGETITVSTGTGTAATANVTEADANGALVSIAILTRGSYTVNPNTEDSSVTASANGIDATVNVTMTIDTTTINDGGVFSALPTTIANNTPTSDGSGVGGVDLSFGVYEVIVSSNGSGYLSTTAAVAFAGGSNAAGVVVLQGAAETKGVAHQGWVLRKEGTGGRAGRVQYETLVAMTGGMNNDASDDESFPE